MLVLVLISVCILLFYRYTTRNHDYWAKRNVKHKRPLPFFGNHLRNFLTRRTVVDSGIEMLSKFKGEQIVGYYRGNTPELIIRDPEIVKHILTVDFKNFADRGLNENTRKDPLLHNILFANVDNWRTMRQRLSPGFTKSKLRKMFPQIQKSVDELTNAVEGYASREETVKAYDLMVGFTLQCIGSCCLGVELNTISQQSQFTVLAKNFFDKTKPQMVFKAITELIPEAEFLCNHVKIIDKDLESIIMTLTRNITEKRLQKPSMNRDFIDVFLEMSTRAIDENHRKLGEAAKKKLHLQFTAAQVFFFLFAGFETTATAMSGILHQLAYHQDIQQKIQKEIDSVLSKHDNKLIDSIEEMTQLDMAFKESMRLLTPIGSVSRICVDTCTLPGTDVTIDRGVRIVIPIQALHLDSDYYENPEEFRPERFSTDSAKGVNYKYLAFGEGPKKCIGYKLALAMASAGLAAILRRYTVVPASDTRTLSIKKTSYLAQVVDGGIPVKFIPRVLGGVVENKAILL